MGARGFGMVFVYARGRCLESTGIDIGGLTSAGC